MAVMMLQAPRKDVEPMDHLGNLAAVQVIGLADIVALLRRRRALVAIGVCSCLLLGGLYILLTTPKYEAVAQLLIETEKLEVFGTGNVFEDVGISNAAVETQIQVLRSRLISEAVVRKLALDRDASFLNKGGLRSIVKNWIKELLPEFEPAPPPPAEEQLLLQALTILQKNLSVARAGLSYVVNVKYVSSDAEEAAGIANAIMDAYLQDRSSSQASAAGRATEWLQARLDELRQQSFDSSIPAEERSAVRATYESLLNRYTETVDQGSLPVTQARVVSLASPPSVKSWPKPLLIVAGSLAAGLMLGFGTAIARDLTDRSIRTRAQLESATGAPHLGALPIFRLGRRQKRSAGRIGGDQSGALARKFSVSPSYSIAAGAPFSRFAETLRNIKVMADAHEAGPLVVIGVTSSVPNEGKTTVAANLAQLVGQSGVRTLLIDGDLRNPTLSRDFVGAEPAGLIQVLTSRVSSSDAIWQSDDEKLHLLPAGIDSRLLNGSEILSSATMKDLLGELRRRYDFVVVDLPPVLPVVDVRAAAHLLDGLLFVVEWERITKDEIGDVFRHPEVERRIIGTVFNKVRHSKLKRFERQPSNRASDIYIDEYPQVT